MQNFLIRYIIFVGDIIFMTYEELISELKNFADDKYRAFHKRLLKNESINVLGVCVPVLRQISKKFNSFDELINFPNYYYEVIFIKLICVASLPYEQFIKYADTCVSLIDNWATCDAFKPKCITRHREEFLPYIQKYASSKKEYHQRFAITCLLYFYIDEKHLSLIFDIIENCNKDLYYVSMAAAWLVAEILIKYYSQGVNFLLKNSLDKITHNKAIQKAVESFRLSNDNKNYLKGIKR